MPPESHCQKAGGTLISAVETLSRSVKTKMDAPSDSVMRTARMADGFPRYGATDDDGQERQDAGRKHREQACDE